MYETWSESRDRLSFTMKRAARDSMDGCDASGRFDEFTLRFSFIHAVEDVLCEADASADELLALSSFTDEYGCVDPYIAVLRENHICSPGIIPETVNVDKNGDDASGDPGRIVSGSFADNKNSLCSMAAYAAKRICGESVDSWPAGRERLTAIVSDRRKEILASLSCGADAKLARKLAACDDVLEDLECEHFRMSPPEIDFILSAWNGHPADYLISETISRGSFRRAFEFIRSGAKESRVKSLKDQPYLSWVKTAIPDFSLDGAGLETHARNILNRERIFTLRDLVRFSYDRRGFLDEDRIRSLPSCGEKSARRIREVVSSYTDIPWRSGAEME